MTSQVGTGSSTKKQTAAAVTEATGQAMAALGNRKPSFGFVFAGSEHKLQDALQLVRSSASGVIIGCSTAGEITERGLTRSGVTVCLVAMDDVVHDVVVAGNIKSDALAAAGKLTSRFAALASQARERRLVESTTVTLIDGLAGTGEQIVSSVMKSTRPSHQLVGGAAGDDGRFQSTWVGDGTRALSDGAVAMHLFSARPFGVGVDHGLRPSTAKMVVTKSARNVVYELDGKPAFEVYRKYAKERGVELTRENAGSFLINNELGVYFLNHVQRARAPLSVGAKGELSCAANIEEGSSVSILDGKPDELLSAARRAAEEAQQHLAGARCAGVLLFDCICRGTILDKEFDREIDAVRSVFPKVPIAGFLTYGEIARYKGRLDGWHNTTAVVVAIPA